jgi:hypothetical protein
VKINTAGTTLSTIINNAFHISDIFVKMSGKYLFGYLMVTFGIHIAFVGGGDLYSRKLFR